MEAQNHIADDDDGFLMYPDVIASPSSPVRNGEFNRAAMMRRHMRMLEEHRRDAERDNEENNNIPSGENFHSGGEVGEGAENTHGAMISGMPTISRSLTTLDQLQSDVKDSKKSLQEEHSNRIDRGQALREAVMEVVRVQAARSELEAENRKMREALEKSCHVLEQHSHNEEQAQVMLQNARVEIQQLQDMLAESNKLNAALMVQVQTLNMRRNFQPPPSHTQQPLPPRFQGPGPPLPGGFRGTASHVATGAAGVVSLTPRYSQASTPQPPSTSGFYSSLGKANHGSTPMSGARSVPQVDMQANMTEEQRREEEQAKAELQRTLDAAIAEGRVAMAEEEERKKAEEAALVAAMSPEEIEENKEAIKTAIQARKEADENAQAINNSIIARRQAAEFEQAASTIETLSDPKSGGQNMFEPNLANQNLLSSFSLNYVNSPAVEAVDLSKTSVNELLGEFNKLTGN